MKAWITKYALTSGIMEKEGSCDDTHFTKTRQDGDWMNEYYHGKERNGSRVK